jgi:hypothetical protein
MELVTISLFGVTRHTERYSGFVICNHPVYMHDVGSQCFVTNLFAICERYSRMGWLNLRLFFQEYWAVYKIPSLKSNYTLFAYLVED